MDKITRKSMLYKTGVEYGDYTMNHVLGCAHGCLYPCYAFLMAKRFGKVSTYDEWTSPRLVSNALEILDKEIPRLRSKIKSVQLCFTTDPFMCGYGEISDMSIASIEKLNASGIKCTVLTKGILPIALASLSRDNEYGITLVSLNEDYRKANEPGAATFSDRISALKKLSDKGFKTWVSIEPYPTPNIVTQDIRDILEAIEFTNRIIFGRTNYSHQTTSYKNHRAFYNQQVELVVAFCEAHGIAYHIKSGTMT
jgi:DNA repair photolyase